MNIENLKNLKDSPEIQAFIEHCKREMQRLDSVMSLVRDGGAQDMNVEVRARELAIKTVAEILSPFIDMADLSTGGDVKEYVV